MTFSPPQCFRICAGNRSSSRRGILSDSGNHRERGREIRIEAVSKLLLFGEKGKKKVISLSGSHPRGSKIGVNARLVGQCQSTTSVRPDSKSGKEANYREPNVARGGATGQYLGQC